MCIPKYSITVQSVLSSPQSQPEARHVERKGDVCLRVACAYSEPPRDVPAKEYEAIPNLAAITRPRSLASSPETEKLKGTSIVMYCTCVLNRMMLLGSPRNTVCVPQRLEHVRFDKLTYT